MNFAAPLLRWHLSQWLLQVRLRLVQGRLIAFISRKMYISQTRSVMLRAFKALVCSPRVR